MDSEKKRIPTGWVVFLALLAGLDLHSGTVTEIVSDSHKSKDFIEFLKRLDLARPPTVVLRLILDNHSAHIS